MSGGRVAGDDGGFVLVWMAVMLFVLIGLAGLAVDLGNWYWTANREQKAADAGALGGAVLLPGDPRSAISTAVATVATNGYARPDDAVSSDQDGLLPTQLRVTITHKVDNFFLGMFGIRKTTIRRTAVAEYQGPIPMGSPDNRLGNDPDAGFAPQLWVNIDAPNSDKETGDRFAAADCKGFESQCVGGGASTNTEFGADGYAFTIRVPKPSPNGDPLDVQVFDAETAFATDNCGTDKGVNYPTAGDVATLHGLDDGAVTDPVPHGYYDDAAQRYDGSATSRYCVGDTTTTDTSGSPAFSTDMATTYVVRAPDDTPFDAFDNPIATDVSGQACVVQAKTYDLRGGGRGDGQGLVTELLVPGDGRFGDHEATVDRADDFTLYPGASAWTGASFAETYKRWFSVCQVPSAQTGDYVLQVKTSTRLGSPNSVDLDLAGKNRMSFRAGFAVGTDAPVRGGVDMYGDGRLPLFANAVGANSTFYLARVVPAGGNRVLVVPLFDVGDAQNTGTLTVLYDPDGDGVPSRYTLGGGCDFIRDFGTTLHSNNCQLGGVCFACGYNGRIVTAEIPIPAGYTCDSTTPKGCWFLVNASFPGGTVGDTTTWQAYIRGDPVHLIQ